MNDQVQCSVAAFAFCFCHKYVPCNTGNILAINFCFKLSGAVGNYRNGAGKICSCSCTHHRIVRVRYIRRCSVQVSNTEKIFSTAVQNISFKLHVVIDLSLVANAVLIRVRILISVWIFNPEIIAALQGPVALGLCRTFPLQVRRGVSLVENGTQVSCICNALQVCIWIQDTQALKLLQLQFKVGRIVAELKVVAGYSIFYLIIHPAITTTDNIIFGDFIIQAQPWTEIIPISFCATGLAEVVVVKTQAGTQV